ncbi:CDP-alcohol phosphatidyltransferase family protein [Kushneria phosphatilytica]|uniref:CDP-alcohol phosphatidyltransferase family protein n=1 Tax=Kushneria phosphatilytica TaxID=657387 RepID=A0A5C0ZXY4_9GAMM|nr:CDP-alcohol phosphatidyltransferase family protein [Kushneria phosphatilytica]QEL10734.1 CDP-alcohol phosphatidyltransferase family protein [Kushneria phosphatilytica]
MLDRWLRRATQPPLRWLARHSIYWRVTPLGASLTGLALAVFVMVMLVLNYYMAALAGLLLNRFFDGLDGALARAMGEDETAGRFLDTCLDSLYRVLFLIGFALADPSRNTLPALILMATSGVLDMGIAQFEAQTGQRRGVLRHAHWSLRLLDMITHATPRLLILVAACVWPERFPVIVLSYAGIQGPLMLARVILGYRWLSRQDRKRQLDRARRVRVVASLKEGDSGFTVPPWR